MKIFRLAAVAALLLACTPALAQWQTPNHSIPIGKGSGVQGFGNAAPGTAGRPLVSQGAAADPAFGTIANSGFTPGAANTAKGTLDGAAVTDLPLPSCTAVNKAWRYTSGTGINCGTLSLTTGFDTPVNLGLSASAAGGALTINLTQADGTAPSSANPVLAPFRSTTAATGTVTWTTISAATSLTIPSGATLGTANTVPFRVWIFLDYNGGTPSLGAATCSNTTTVFPCASWEYALKTSTTISAGAGSAGTLYAASGVTLDSVRIVGFCDFANGLVTAGSWASSCTTLQVHGPGIKKPGETVQTVAPSFGTLTVVTYGAAATTTNVTASITPTSAANLVRYLASVSTATTTGGNGCQLQMYRGSTAIGAIQKQGQGTGGGNIANSVTVVGLDSPGAVSAQIYALKGTQITGGTCSTPAVNTDSATEILEEIMG